MSKITLQNAAIDTRSAAGPDLFADEPSHIHIPRPSRLRKSASPEHKEPEPTALPLVLADEAA